MHFMIEIVLPPVDNVEKVIEEALEEYHEGNEGAYNAFYDFYVIGGRFAGNKLQSKLDKDKLDEFHNQLQEMKVTVSGFTAGKQELKPASQRETVDQLWRDYFPNSGIDICPLFKHSNDQYDSSDTLLGDICQLSEVSDDYTACRFLFLSQGYEDKWEVNYMVQADFWNGTAHLETTWDRTKKHALEMYLETLEIYRDETRLKPQDDWLCVTVDCHS